MQLKELFTNDNGRLSTTNTIQMMSAITLCISLFVSLFLDRSVTGEPSYCSGRDGDIDGDKQRFCDIEEALEYGMVLVTASLQ